jgi:hypothetical protein
MVSADESRPGTGPGQISGRAKASRNKPSGKVAEQRQRRPSQDKQGQDKQGQDKQSQDRENQDRQSQSVEVQKPELTPDELLAATETLPDTAQPMEQPLTAAETRDAAADIVAEPADPAPVSVRAIADAYDDYTRKSIEQTSSFFQQLAGTRSFGAVLELQSQFARSTFETFVDESRKIRELHRELAKQRLQSLEGFVMGRRTSR